MIRRRIKVLPKRAVDAHKYSHGKVAVIAGSNDYPGAAVLTTGGARRGGAGYIAYVSSDELPTTLVLQAFPDVVRREIEGLEADAWVIGSGNPILAMTLEFTASQYLVLDAGAISRVKESRSAVTVITPHEGEFKELGYEIASASDRRFVVSQAARELNAYVLLKGPQTIISSPSGLLAVDSSGGPELATAGTGDVLAGFIAAMLASWKPDSPAKVMEVLKNSVRAHSLAGKQANKHYKSMTSDDLLKTLPIVIR
jgi:hydroxyethylthiazole kinase-like uncharacterized protein yjeF